MIEIYNIEGASGFYRGLWPAIIQIMPYMGLLFSSYDLFAKGFKKLRVSKLIPSFYLITAANKHLLCRMNKYYNKAINQHMI